MWRDIVKERNITSSILPTEIKGVEYMPISDQAYSLCGERGDADRLVFEGYKTHHGLIDLWNDG